MTDNSPQPRLVIYDGDCPVCTATAKRLRKRTWSTPHEVVAFQDLEPELAAMMTEAGIERQMLILDAATDEITSGFEAVRAIEDAGGRAWLADLLGIPGVAQIGALAYRLFAVNRRLFSPVPAGIQCACDPEPEVWERGLAWAFLLLPVVAFAALTTGPQRTVFIAFCLMWMVPVLAGLLDQPDAGRIAGQLGVALAAAATVGLAVWAVTWLWDLLAPSSNPPQLLLALFSMWLVGGWMLFRRLKTIGAPRLRWLWHLPLLLVLMILLLVPLPVG